MTTTQTTPPQTRARSGLAVDQPGDRGAGARARRRYHPDTLVAFEGDTITFNVANRGEDEHGFTVDGLGIADVLGVEETGEYTAEAVAAGVYPYCQLHEAHIRGQLVVLRR